MTDDGSGNYEVMEADTVISAQESQLYTVSMDRRGADVMLAGGEDGSLHRWDLSPWSDGDKGDKKCPLQCTEVITNAHNGSVYGSAIAEDSAGNCEWMVSSSVGGRKKRRAR